jgi:hypothetical protein
VVIPVDASFDSTLGKAVGRESPAIPSLGGPFMWAQMSYPTVADGEFNVPVHEMQ